MSKMITKTFLKSKKNHFLLVSFLIFFIFIIVLSLTLLKEKKLYKIKASPSQVPSCAGKTKIECWGECEPGTRQEYTICCTQKNTQNQCVAWCNDGLIDANSPRCPLPTTPGGGTTSCEGAKNTCCGGQRYMPDGSIGNQPWCHSDDYEYTCNCPNQAGFYSPCKTGNRCGAYSSTNGQCEKSDCSVSRDPCPPGNVACADDISCNADCPSVRKQFDVCRGRITNNNCQSCVGSCEDQYYNRNQPVANCDITCQCVEELKNKGIINNDQYRNLAGSCAYYHGNGCPNPANYPCSNIQSDVVAWGTHGDWVYLCHSMWEDGRSWWECQSTPTPTPTTTPTPTSTPTSTPSPTSTPTSTPTGTPPPTSTPTNTPTPTEIILTTISPTQQQPTTQTRQQTTTVPESGTVPYPWLIAILIPLIIGLIL